MKTNKILKTQGIIILLITALLSCTDDFLDTEVHGRTAQENFYQSDEEAMWATASAYDILQSLWAQDWNSLWMVKTIPSDEVNAGGGGPSDQGTYQNLNDFLYSVDNTPIQTVYQTLYMGIFRANTVIENVEPDSPAKTINVAEAKFMRAYYHFELVTLFGEVPLVTEVLHGDEYAQSAASTDEIWQQIETDLEEAIEDLSAKSEYSDAHQFRVGQGAAQALLGKAHLYQEEYADALTYFNELTPEDHPEHGLAEDFSLILRQDTEFGVESLFEVNYTTSQGNNWDNFAWGNNGRNQENNIHWQLCGPRGDGYFEGGNTGLINGWGFAYPTTEMWEAFEEDDDIRREASVMNEDTLLAHGGKLRNEDDELAYQCEGFVRLKYGTWLSETAGPVNELNYGTNLRIIRYADVLLMAAEAHYFEGQEEDARNLINRVRDRADLGEITASGQDLFDAIVRERQVELAFEGHRLMDLIRWDMAGDELSDRGYMPKHSVFPIPQAELDINPNLEQHDAWK